MNGRPASSLTLKSARPAGSTEINASPRALYCTLLTSTLSEAAESLGARPVTVLLRVVLPNIRSAVLSGAFLTVAIVLGEFTFASLLDRPAFGPYMQLLGANRAYEPAALSLVAFGLIWVLMVGIGLVGRRRWAR